jgi:hypothetical protein
MRGSAVREQHVGRHACMRGVSQHIGNGIGLHHHTDTPIPFDIAHRSRLFTLQSNATHVLCTLCTLCTRTLHTLHTCVPQQNTVCTHSQPTVAHSAHIRFTQPTVPHSSHTHHAVHYNTLCTNVTHNNTLSIHSLPSAAHVLCTFTLHSAYSRIPLQPT